MEKNDLKGFLSFSPSAPGWQLGFRPFFGVGAIWGALLIAYWVFYQLNLVGWSSHLNPVFFHAHEMIFGFVSAVIMGFLFTATQNWAGQRGIHGRKLQFVFVLWLAGRILALLPGSWGTCEAVIDGAFFVAAAVLLYDFLKSKAQNKNKIFLVLLFAMAGLDAAMHLLLPTSALWARQCYLWAVGIILLMVTVIGGRVIPFFTTRAVPGSTPIKSTPVEVAVFLTTFLTFLLEPFTHLRTIVALFALLAMAAHGMRWFLWKPWQARRVPILWVLHIGYFWFVPGMLLRGLSFMGMAPATLSTHAFTVGVISTLILGMTSRVALGHTGRPIRARTTMVAAYILITVAALVRVFVPLEFPGYYLWAIGLAGTAWVLAYLLFIHQYTGLLLAVRADGKPG